MPGEENSKGRDARFICNPGGRDKNELMALETVMYTLIGAGVLLSMVLAGVIISSIMPGISLGKNAILAWISLMGVLFLVMSLYLIFNLLAGRGNPEEEIGRGLEVMVSDRQIRIVDRTGIWQRPNEIPVSDVVDIERADREFFESRNVRMPLLFRPFLQMAPRPRFLIGSFYPRKTIFEYLLVLHLKKGVPVRRNDDNTSRIVREISKNDPSGSLVDRILIAVRPDDHDRFLDLMGKRSGISLKDSPPHQPSAAEDRVSGSTSGPS